MVKQINQLKLWKFSRKIIPGGNSLISKRPELFAPNKWPTYFKKSKGCKIWDLNNKLYYDFSLMSVGTNLLGYSNEKIDRYIKKIISQGNMSSLNCYEEVQLANKILKLHKWAEAVKFAKTGGEANAIAIRISRAVTNKDNIAICGYHGWHDWYQAANLKKKNNLDQHLIKNVDTQGVCKKLINTVHTFEYNNFDQFKSIIEKKNIGTVMMEVSRNYGPKNNFLNLIRKECTKKKIILIFDECSSGFRETLGGLHLKYKVNPDLAMFGKALGNGYPITAVIGRSRFMKFANNSFISSTFWTDRIGFAAALKTLEIMEKTKSFNYITKLGKKIKNFWLKISKKYNIPINIAGLDAMPNFTFNKKHQLYTTFLTREMLKKNILATNSIYLSTAHNQKNLKIYFKELENIFKKISVDQTKKYSQIKISKKELRKSSFSRIN